MGDRQELNTRLMVRASLGDVALARPEEGDCTPTVAEAICSVLDLPASPAELAFTHPGGISYSLRRESEIRVTADSEQLG